MGLVDATYNWGVLTLYLLDQHNKCENRRCKDVREKKQVGSCGLYQQGNPLSLKETHVQKC